MTTANAWEELSPETVCLDTGEMSSVSLQLRLYGTSSMEGLSGAKIEDHRYPPKEKVFVVAEGSQSVAFTAAELRKRKSASVQLADEALLLEWDTGSARSAGLPDDGGRARGAGPSFRSTGSPRRGTSPESARSPSSLRRGRDLGVGGPADRAGGATGATAPRR